jgi:hypothetical protein
MLPITFKFFPCGIFYQSFTISLILFVLSFKIVNLVSVWLLRYISTDPFSIIITKISDVLITILKKISTFSMHHIIAEITIILLIISELIFSISILLSIYEVTLKDFIRRMMFLSIAIWDAIDCNSLKYDFIR